MTKAERILEFYKEHKEWTNRRISQELGISKRHVRRILNPIRGYNFTKKIPKILLLDIETMMMEVFVWFLGKQRIPYDNVIQEWNCISWAAKWLFASDVMSDIQTPEEAKNREDKRILTSLWPLVNEADIIIGQNLSRFDVRKINARFLYHNFIPPFSYQVVDTLTEMKRYFAFSSYRLDDVCKFLKLNTKIESSYGLWKRCLAGDEKSLNRMNTYNKNDVLILEELYLRIRPWIKSHPNVGLYMDTDNNSVCSNCGSDKLKHEGKYYTPAGRFLAFRCESCGAVCRSRYSDIDREERESLVISVAR
jgi:AraC-like DNA-binding protein